LAQTTPHIAVFTHLDTFIMPLYLIKKMSAIQPVLKQFILQTKLFNNVLDGIEDRKGSDRLSDYVNHLQWIAGHLTNSRYHLSPALGLASHFPFEDVYTDLSQPPPYNRAIDPSVKYPSLTEIKKSWNEFAPGFADKISGLSSEQLGTETPVTVPTGKTLSDLLSFIASHESYHIGQMSIIRKYLGLPAMSYR
jgi:DinB superfamily